MSFYLEIVIQMLFIYYSFKGNEALLFSDGSNYLSNIFKNKISC